MLHHVESRLRTEPPGLFRSDRLMREFRLVVRDLHSLPTASGRRRISQ